MSQSEQLTELLREWEVLTEAESEAITQDAWNRLHAVQEQKTQLRADIADLHDRLIAGGENPGTSPWQPIVARLVRQEFHNQENLTRRRTQLETERLSLQRTGARLNSVHQAYVPDPERQWSTYS
ncbi:MAG: hypothetical protein ACKVHO_17505 [Verrucomicrobiia bacterium]|jgi:hypothetical protein